MATINKIDLNGDTYDIESSGLVTTQPTNPTEGAVYYDTVNDVVKVYDGTNWNPISGGGGSGDVVGPNSSTNGHLAVFDGATGKLLKDGGAIPTVPTNVSDFNNDAGYITGINSTDVTTALGYTPVNPSTLGTAATKNTGTSSGNVPVLDSNGHLASSTIPGVALTDTFTVSTSSDLTTLSNADQGDLAIVSSENKTYVLSQAPYSTASNWKQILSPTGGVTSVNGQTGAVTLSIPTDTSDLTNGAGFLTSSTGVTSFNGSHGAITYTAPVSSVNTKTGAVTVSEFAPGGTATTGYVVTKTANGYEWSAPTEPTVVSGDSGVTYTIKVSNSDPASGTASNIITLVP